VDFQLYVIRCFKEKFATLTNSTIFWLSNKRLFKMKEMRYLEKMVIFCRWLSVLAPSLFIFAVYMMLELSNLNIPYVPFAICAFALPNFLVDIKRENIFCEICQWF